MFRYAAARFDPEEAARRLCSRPRSQDTGDLPPFLTAQLVFPYTAGERSSSACSRPAAAAGTS